METYLRLNMSKAINQVSTEEIILTFSIEEDGTVSVNNA